MSKFVYDAVTLIKLIHAEPCLWNKAHADFKNKAIRDKKWQKIFKNLDKRYTQRTVAEKKKTAELIMLRWTNIRDAFKRSLKKSAQIATKTYLYAEHLQFLLKSSESAETASNYNQEDTSSETSLPSESSVRPQFCYITEDSSSEPCPSLKNNSIKRELDDHDNDTKCEILPNITKLVQNPVRDDHEMLLLSFSTYTRDMTEEELMEFQMETLKTIRNIKRKRVSASSSVQNISFSDAYFK